MKGLFSALITLLLTFGGGYYYGKHVEAEAQQLEIDRLNTQARAKEQAFGNALTATTNALRKTNEKAKLAAKERDLAIDSGALRLRLKASCPVSAPADPATPSGGGGGEASAELSPEAGKALFAIAEEGDRAISKLNACIFLYNQAIESQKGIK